MTLIRISLAVVLLLATMQSAAAQNRHTGDMFTDQGWDMSGRLPVPSDQYRNPDMLPSAPVDTYNPNADVFSHLHPNYDYGRQDMLITHQAPVPAYPILNYPPPKE
jgi:hypothetical protein